MRGDRNLVGRSGGAGGVRQFLTSGGGLLPGPSVGKTLPMPERGVQFTVPNYETIKKHFEVTKNVSKIQLLKSVSV